MDFSFAYQAFIQLFSNDYFFYSFIAGVFFAFGAFCANEYNKHRYQEHFWCHLETRRKLREQVRILEQKQ